MIKLIIRDVCGCGGLIRLSLIQPRWILNEVVNGSCAQILSQIPSSERFNPSACFAEHFVPLFMFGHSGFIATTRQLCITTLFALRDKNTHRSEEVLDFVCFCMTILKIGSILITSLFRCSIIKMQRILKCQIEVRFLFSLYIFEATFL